MAALVETVRQDVPRLRSATKALESARDDLDRIVTERDLLAGITVPDDVAELDDAHTAADAALTVAAAAEAAARQADRDARDRLAAAPDRGPLDQALRDHAELARVGAALPDARATARPGRRAADRDDHAGRRRVDRTGSRPRSARDVARATVSDLGAQRSSTSRRRSGCSTPW